RGGGRACPAAKGRMVTLKKVANGGLSDGGWMFPGKRKGFSNEQRSARSQAPEVCPNLRANDAAVKSSLQAVPTRSNTSTRWLSNSRLLCSPSGSKRNAGLNTCETANVSRLQRARLKTGSAH